MSNNIVTKSLNYRTFIVLITMIIEIVSYLILGIVTATIIVVFILFRKIKKMDVFDIDSIEERLKESLYVAMDNKTKGLMMNSARDMKRLQEATIRDTIDTKTNGAFSLVEAYYPRATKEAMKQFTKLIGNNTTLSDDLIDTVMNYIKPYLTKIPELLKPKEDETIKKTPFY